MKRFLAPFFAIVAVIGVAACSSSSTDSGTAGGSGSGNQDGGSGIGRNGLSRLQNEFRNQIGDRVFFETNSTSLNTEGRHTLDGQAAFLQQHPSLTVVVEGHCDERGTREYNLGLGERRAQAVKDYLMARGVSGSRLSVVSYGKERPESLGSNATAWGQNRRGVSVLVE